VNVLQKEALPLEREDCIMARIDDYMWTLHSSILAEVMVVIDDSKE
jgi:hypothetical protein